MKTLTTVVITFAVACAIFSLLDGMVGSRQQQPEEVMASRALTEEDNDKLSCKMNELAVRSNIAIHKLENAEGKANQTLEAASSIPAVDISHYANLLCVEGQDLKNIKSMSIVVPSDWECQSRKAGEPWACPQGTPSSCRYFDSARRVARRASHPFGVGVDLSNLTEADLKEVDDMCVRYFCEGLGASYKADSQFNLLGTKDTCCNYFEPLGKVVLSDKVQNMLGLDTTLAWKMDEFIDPSKTNWEPKVATICGKFDTNAPPDEDGKPGGDAWKNTFGIWLKERYWGYSDWRDDPNVGKHMITVAINRFEMGPAFGVQFYTPQLDTIRVRSNGDAEFNPTTATLDIALFNNMTYAGVSEYECPDDPYNTNGDASVSNARRQLGLLPDGEHDKSTEVVQPTMQELAAERFRGSCHPLFGCKQELPKQDDQSAKRSRRELRRGGGGLFGGGSFVMMSANRAGND